MVPCKSFNRFLRQSVINELKATKLPPRSIFKQQENKYPGDETTPRIDQTSGSCLKVRASKRRNSFIGFLSGSITGRRCIHRESLEYKFYSVTKLIFFRRMP